MKGFLNKFGILILIAVVLLSGTFLFFEDSMGIFADVLGLKTIKKIDESGQVLKIAYLFSPKDLNPFSGDSAVNSRLNDVYEGLVAVDENLGIRPALAVSYGMLTDKEWQLHLRDNVKFHNGKLLSAEDVIYSFKQASAISDGAQSELNATIEKFEKINDSTIRLITKNPDPLLLNKLSKLPIIPLDYAEFSKPIGTGPYKLVDASSLSDIDYKRNLDYWGEQPYFNEVRISSIANKNDRVNSLVNGDINFLANVPPDSALELKASGLNIAIMPSLEVGFIMFNLNDTNFQNKSLRVAVAKGLNKESFLDLAFGYAKTVNQFVSNGVFGYNPDLLGYAYDQKEAEQEISTLISSFEKLKVDFYYPESLKLLGQYFKEQLILIGLDVNLNALNEADLQAKLAAQELPFYYLGWRSDSGDSISFLKSVIHSKTGDYGTYNGMNYSNETVDKLIEKSETNLNQKERLADLQTVMKTIVVDDVVGVPLFETESLFAYAKDIKYKPRVDSLIYPSNISK